MWLGAVVLTVIRNIEFNLKELRIKKIKVKYEVQKEINSLEKEFLELKNELLMRIMFFDKERGMLNEKNIDKMIVENEYRNKFMMIDVELNEIYEKVVNEFPSFECFELLCDDENGNYLENNFMKNIKKHRYFIEVELNVSGVKKIDEKIKERSKFEIKKRKEIMERFFDQGNQYINDICYEKCYGDDVKKEVKSKFKEMFNEQFKF